MADDIYIQEHDIKLDPRIRELSGLDDGAAGKDIDDSIRLRSPSHCDMSLSTSDQDEDDSEDRSGGRSDTSEDDEKLCQLLREYVQLLHKKKYKENRHSQVSDYDDDEGSSDSDSDDAFRRAVVGKKGAGAKCRRPSVVILGERPPNQETTSNKRPSLTIYPAQKLPKVTVKLKDICKTRYCKPCEVLFPDSDALNKHNTKVHILYCKHCDTSFDDFETWIRHMYEVINTKGQDSDNEPINEVVGNTTNTTIGDEKRKDSGVPGDKIDRVIELMSTEDEEERASDISKSSYKESGVRVYSCPDCSCMYRNEKYLKEHVIDNHGERFLQDAYVSAPFQSGCKFCKHETTLLSHNSHILAHHLKTNKSERNSSIDRAVSIDDDDNSVEIIENPVIDEIEIDDTNSPGVSTKIGEIPMSKKREIGKRTIYTCIVCNTKYQNKFYAFKHNREYHPEKPTIKCVRIAKYPPLYNSFIPKDVVFGCMKCPLHYLNCATSMSHRIHECTELSHDSTLLKKVWICPKCKKTFRERDKPFHELQHQAAKKIRYYEFDKLYEKVLCKCKKCNVYFKERKFLMHQKEGCNKKSSSQKCSICKIYVDKIAEHMSKHKIDKLSKADFILIDEFIETSKSVKSDQMKNLDSEQKQNNLKRKSGSVQTETEAKKAKTIAEAPFLETANRIDSPDEVSDGTQTHCRRKLNNGSVKITDTMSSDLKQTGADKFINIFQCKKCKCCSSSLSYVQEHECATEIEVISCSKCDFVTAYDDMADHQRWHEQNSHIDCQRIKIIPFLNGKLIYIYQGISNKNYVYFQCLRCQMLYVKLHDCGKFRSVLCRICKYRFSPKGFQHHQRRHSADDHLNRDSVTIIPVKPERNRASPEDVNDESDEDNNGIPSKDTMYKCASCYCIFASRADFVSHHNNDLCFGNLGKRCDVCGLVFSEKAIDIHMEKHKSTDDVGKSIHSIITLTERGMANYTLHKCDLCKVHFLSKGAFNHHALIKRWTLVKHDIDEKITCNFCGLIFEKVFMDRHIKLHHGVVNYKLEDFNIITHKYNPNYIKRFMPSCMQRTVEVSTNVAERSDNENTTQVQERERSDSDDDGPSVVPTTSVKKKAQIAGRRNQKVLKRIVYNGVVYTNKLFGCECGIKFMRVMTFVHHQKRCSNVIKLPCHVCKYMFTSISLRIHKKIHHDLMNLGVKDMDVISGSSLQTFIDDSRSTVKLKYVHTQRPDTQIQNHNSLFTCKKCDLYFLTKSSVQLHYRKKHQVDTSRIVKCAKCDLRFDKISAAKHQAHHHIKYKYYLRDLHIFETKFLPGSEEQVTGVNKETSSHAGNVCSTDDDDADDCVDGNNDDKKEDTLLPPNTIKPKIIETQRPNPEMFCKYGPILTAKIFKCVKCQICFLSKSAINMHFKLNHPKNKLPLHNCSECGLRFTKSSLTRHMDDHSIYKYRLEDLHMFEAVDSKSEEQERIENEQENVHAGVDNKNDDMPQSDSESDNENENLIDDESSGEEWQAGVVSRSSLQSFNKEMSSHAGKVSNTDDNDDNEDDDDVDDDEEKDHDDDDSVPYEDVNGHDDSKKEDTQLPPNTIKPKLIHTQGPNTRPVKTNQIFKCVKCQICFLTKDSIRLHFRSNHRQIKFAVLKCDECGFKFSKSSATRHRQIHHVEHNYKLKDLHIYEAVDSKCEEQEGDDSEEENVHSGVDDGMGQSDSENDTVSDDKSSGDESQTDASDSTSDSAGESFRGRTIYRQGPNTVPDKNNSLYECVDCRVYYLTYNSAISHIYSGHAIKRGMETCSDCSIRFTKYSAIRHKNIHHNKFKYSFKDLHIYDVVQDFGYKDQIISRPELNDSDVGNLTSDSISDGNSLKGKSPTSLVKNKPKRVRSQKNSSISSSEDSDSNETFVSSLNADSAHKITIRKRKSLNRPQVDEVANLDKAGTVCNNRTTESEGPNNNSESSVCAESRLSDPMHLSMASEAIENKSGRDSYENTEKEIVEPVSQSDNYNRTVDTNSDGEKSSNNVTKTSTFSKNMGNNKSDNCHEITTQDPNLVTVNEEQTDVFSYNFYKCSICKVYFFEDMDCLNHMSNHTPLDPRLYIGCKFCTLQFKVEHLRIHIEKHHDSDDFSLDNVLVKEYQLDEGNVKFVVYCARDKADTPSVRTSTDKETEPKTFIKTEPRFEGDLSSLREHENLSTPVIVIDESSDEEQENRNSGADNVLEETNTCKDNDIKVLVFIKSEHLSEDENAGNLQEKDSCVSATVAQNYKPKQNKGFRNCATEMSDSASRTEENATVGPPLIKTEPLSEDEVRFTQSNQTPLTTSIETLEQNKCKTKDVSEVGTSNYRTEKHTSFDNVINEHVPENSTTNETLMNVTPLSIKTEPLFEDENTPAMECQIISKGPRPIQAALIVIDDSSDEEQAKVNLENAPTKTPINSTDVWDTENLLESVPSQDTVAIDKHIKTTQDLPEGYEASSADKPEKVLTMEFNNAGRELDPEQKEVTIFTVKEASTERDKEKENEDLINRESVLENITSEEIQAEEESFKENESSILKLVEENIEVTSIDGKMTKTFQEKETVTALVSAETNEDVSELFEINPEANTILLSNEYNTVGDVLGGDIALLPKKGTIHSFKKESRETYYTENETSIEEIMKRMFSEDDNTTEVRDIEDKKMSTTEAEILIVEEGVPENNVSRTLSLKEPKSLSELALVSYEISQQTKVIDKSTDTEASEDLSGFVDINPETSKHFNEIEVGEFILNESSIGNDIDTNRGLEGEAFNNEVTKTTLYILEGDTSNIKEGQINLEVSSLEAETLLENEKVFEHESIHERTEIHETSSSQLISSGNSEFGKLSDEEMQDIESKNDVCITKNEAMSNNAAEMQNMSHTSENNPKICGNSKIDKLEHEETRNTNPQNEDCKAVDDFLTSTVLVIQNFESESSETNSKTSGNSDIRELEHEKTRNTDRQNEGCKSVNEFLTSTVAVIQNLPETSVINPKTDEETEFKELADKEKQNASHRNDTCTKSSLFLTSSQIQDKEKGNKDLINRESVLENITSMEIQAEEESLKESESSKQKVNEENIEVSHFLTSSQIQSDAEIQTIPENSVTNPKDDSEIDQIENEETPDNESNINITKSDDCLDVMKDCALCNTSFKESVLNESHLKVSNGEFKCCICGLKCNVDRLANHAIFHQEMKLLIAMQKGGGM